MSVTLTKEQSAAISSRGRVIVSASAGSGKTFVMIERLVTLILEGADIKKVLAVTFTNKAAAQMKERLRTALLRRIGAAEKEERTRLKEQLAALPMADISTIHAFCSRLVRTYFYIPDVDPAFRIISPDDAEGRSISARALDEAFEDFYKESGFEKLLAVYFHKKKDAKLRGIVTDVYTAVRGTADYRTILEQAGAEDKFEDVCGYLADDFRSRARFFADRAEDLGAFFAEHSNKALAVCGDIMSAAEPVIAAKDLFAMTEAAKEGAAITRMPPSTKLSGEELKKHSSLKALSAGIKELYKDLQKYAAREEEYARYLDGRALARGVAALALKYDDVYTRLKSEAGVLDYDDLEHCALKVLENDEAREAVAKKYDFVFVDEYQDVNPAQEKILSLVGGGEVFLVGDAKQSIYGFRGSRSEYFLQKEREFEHSLALTENFRSSAAVLEAVNRIFSGAMTEECAQIDYKSALMRGGARYGEHGGGVYFHYIPENCKENAERGVYSVLNVGTPQTDPQAELIADLIEEEVGSERYDADEGLVKKVAYGDVAVLVRKKTGDAEKVVAALSARNIPVTTTAAVNVCDFWEARLFIDWLSYLDNAEQDIPLAGALLSRVGGFTDGELARIRERFPSPFNFRTACEEYRKKMRDTIAIKLDTFAKKTENYRAFMRVRTAAEMIDLLLSEGLEAEIAAKKDGEFRLRRVRRLSLEATGTVNEFLRRLRATQYRVDYSEGGGEDAVKVLTMHSAKGLEYPVVILASLDKPFHGPDRDEVLYTNKFSFAPKSYDLENKIVYETVLRRASALYMEKEERKGELNLFYVAMTRAKYRLHMLFDGSEGALAPQFAKRFSDFIDFSDCAQYVSEPRTRIREALRRNALVYRPDGETTQKILAAYQRPYAFAESTALPVKNSATALMKEESKGAAPLLKEELAVATTVLTPSTDDGLAYHAFLEHVVFGRSAKEELVRMQKEGLLTEEQFALLKEENLERILALPAIKALTGKRLYREQTFLVALPAREVMDTTAEDEIVLQGAIDLLCEDEHGFLIIDYKYSSHGAEELQKTYARQIAIYRKAVARVMRVDEKTIRAKIVNINRLFEVEM